MLGFIYDELEIRTYYGCMWRSENVGEKNTQRYRNGNGFGEEKNVGKELTTQVGSS